MKKNLLRIAAGFGILFLLFMLVLVIITFVFGDKIKSIAVAELNKELNTQVQVNGDVTFSVFSHFPSASINFRNVVIKETLPQKNDLLNCEKISLLFSIWNLLRSDYVIEKVSAENGTISVRVDSTGRNNYDIFKSGANPSSNFSVKISEADLQNFNIVYDDAKNDQHYSFKTQNSVLNGDFSASRFSLSIHSEAFSNFLKCGTTDFLPGRSLKIEGTIDCDLGKQEYVFRNSSIQINGNEFKVNGSITSLDHGSNLQLSVSSDELKPEEIISLLPQEYADKFSAFSSTGKIHFSGEISGIQSASSSALVNASFQLRDGSISHHDVKQVFQHVNLQGTFTNGNQHNLSSSQISITPFSATVDGDPFNGTLMILDFIHPSVDVMINGRIQLDKIYPLFRDSSITSMDGIVDLHQCFFRGPIARLSSSYNVTKMNAGGKFELHNVKISTPQATYEKLNGSFEIKNNDVNFSHCSFAAGKSDLTFEGSVSNLIPFIFSSINDSLSIKQKVGLNVALTSHQLKWEDLVGTTSASSGGSSDSYSIPEIFYWLAGSVDGTIEHFSYEKFNASNLHGKIIFLPDKIYFNDIGLQAEQGDITAGGSLDISKTRHSLLEMTAQLKHLDIRQLFYELNNFDQNTLTDENLKGILTSSVSMQSTWDDNKLNKNKLHAIADVSVENGELNNFQPMLALATFMKLKELRNIHFSKMQNQLEVKSLRVYIPSMQIFSSALNVQLSGSHGFDNIIDYKVQLNLLRLLTDKFRKSPASEDATDQTTEGFLNLYLTMTGPAADPVIRYDKKAVKQKIAGDLSAEKNNLKDALKKEFGQQQSAEKQAKDWKPQQDPQYFQFEDSSDAKNEGEAEQELSPTQQDQKKALNDFKNIFKKPSPKK